MRILRLSALRNWSAQPPAARQGAVGPHPVHIRVFAVSNVGVVIARPVFVRLGVAFAVVRVFLDRVHVPVGMIYPVVHPHVLAALASPRVRVGRVHEVVAVTSAACLLGRHDQALVPGVGSSQEFALRAPFTRLPVQFGRMGAQVVDAPPSARRVAGHLGGLATSANLVPFRVHEVRAVAAVENRALRQFDAG